MKKGIKYLKKKELRGEVSSKKWSMVLSLFDNTRVPHVTSKDLTLESEKKTNLEVPYKF